MMCILVHLRIAIGLVSNAVVYIAKIGQAATLSAIDEASEMD